MRDEDRFPLSDITVRQDRHGIPNYGHKLNVGIRALYLRYDGVKAQQVMRKNAVGRQFSRAFTQCPRPFHDLVHDMLVHGPKVIREKTSVVRSTRATMNSDSLTLSEKKGAGR